MPAHVFGLGSVSVKVAAVSPRSGNRPLHTTSATIYIFDSKTGLELGRIAADNLTAIRTAASSALATDILALKKIDTLGVIGTGKQALFHVPAMLKVRSVSQILVYSRSKAHRAAFVRKVSSDLRTPTKVAASAGEVARKSDVLVLATNSSAPLFKGSIVSPGTHVNAIGAALPSSREMDTTLVKRSILVVDSIEQAFTTYGDILIPLKNKEITKSHVRAELGYLLLEPKAVERRRSDITIFKSGGLGVLDAVFADYVVSQFLSPKFK
jgi:alanine dehydrogenase